VHPDTGALQAWPGDGSCPQDGTRHLTATVAATVAVADHATVWRELVPFLGAQPGAVQVKRGRWVGGGKVSYAGRAVPAPSVVPVGPVAVRTYTDAGFAHVLWLDLDPGKVAGGVAAVQQQAADLARLLVSCGGRVIHDRSSRGGHHLVVPLAAAVGVAVLKPIVAGLQMLFPALDVSPAVNVAAGCMTPPGSVDRFGRPRLLLTGLGDAIDAVRLRSAADFLDRLRDCVPAPVPVQPEPALARTGQRGSVQTTRTLDALQESIAVRGIWPATRRTAAGQQWTGSEARFSVLCAAAARGWCLDDVKVRMKSGRWAGLVRLFARYGDAAGKQLEADWARALVFVSRQRPAVSDNHTSGNRTSQRGRRSPAVPDPVRADYRFIRRWYATMEAAVLAGEFGGQEAGRTRHAVLRSLAVAAMRTGNPVVGLGVRGLSFEAGMLEHSTVARVLRSLRDEADGWIVLTRRGRGDRPDEYRLTIPSRLAQFMDGKPLPVGKLAGVAAVYHPQVLGLAAWRVTDAIASGARTVEEIVVGSGVFRASVYRCVDALRKAGLITRSRRGWRRTRRSERAAGRDLAVPELVAARVEQYRAERAAWRAALADRGRLDWAELTWLASVDGPLWWPDVNDLVPPPNDPDPPLI
jgi:hypothetical protein